MPKHMILNASGAYQDGAGLTLGEKVEQCNAFLSRITVTTKYMSKAGHTDMLTLMAMRWNQQKFNNLATALTQRYQKTKKNDVKEWADATTITTTNDVDALASRIEVLVASIKRRSQHLYKDTDGNKGRAKICHKIREEKGILTSVVEKYNKMVPNTETLCLETILSGVTAWPWHLPHSDLQYGLNEEGLKGLQSIIHRKQRKIRDMRVQARDCYLQVLSGAENITFLNKSSADDFDSNFEISDDEM